MDTSTTNQKPARMPEQETHEVLLQRFDRYIVTSTRQYICHYPRFTHRAIRDLETDELIQRVRIKFWHALERGAILRPHVYIRCIIRSEFIDMIRRQENLLPLLDEETALKINEAIVATGSDPAEEVEQRMDELICLDEVVRLVLRLPRRQRFAMMCALWERVDNLAQLMGKLKDHGIETETLRWPTDVVEKRTLQASLAVARRNLAKQMKESTSQEISSLGRRYSR